MRLTPSNSSLLFLLLLLMWRCGNEQTGDAAAGTPSSLFTLLPPETTNIRWGVPGTSMPSAVERGITELADQGDLLAYTQTLPAQ